MAEAAAAASIPARVGRFEILRLLQEAGMGRLYVARHPTLQQEVVLKTLTARARRHGDTAVARLRREAEILAKLRHEGLCPVLDFIEEEGEQYVVMPLIDGEDLSVRIARAARAHAAGAPLAESWNLLFDDDAKSKESGLARILELTEAIARAVHVAHDGAVIHRDLKPSNVMVRGNGRPVILDFGVALDRESAGPALTEGHSTPGTIYYMSPEQLRGRRDDVDRRSDVYSLGAILYELLTLRRAIGATDTDAAVAQILGGHIDPPRRDAQEIPPDVEAVCLHALDRERDFRYASALELAEELRRCREGRPTIARPLTPTTRALRWARRNKLLASTAAVALLAAIAAAIGLGLFAHESERTAGVLNRFKSDTVFLLDTLQHRWDEGSPEPAALERLATIFPQRKVADLLAQTPMNGAQLNELLSEIAPGYRGDEESSITPLGPIAGILGGRPIFRFRVEQLARSPMRLDVVLELPEGPQVLGSATARTPGETLEVAMPDGMRLTAGDSLDWIVRPASEEDRKDWPKRYQRFTVVEPALHAEALRSLPRTNDPAADGLLRAAACLSLELGQAALDELASTPADPRFERTRLLLEAQARRLLRDDASVRALEARLFPR